MKFFLLFIFIFTLPGVTQDFFSQQKPDSIKTSLDIIFEDRLFKESDFGFMAKSLRDGRVLYEKNAGSLLSSASCMKLVTTAAALDRWGSNYQFEPGFTPTEIFPAGSSTAIYMLRATAIRILPPRFF